MKTFLTLCIIICTNLMAQQLQWETNLNVQNNPCVLNLKYGKSALISGDSLFIVSGAGEVLQRQAFSGYNGKHRVVDAFHAERLIVGGINSLRIYDYNGILQDTVAVPTDKGTLRIWSDSVSASYLIATDEVFAESQLFIYDANLNLICSQIVAGSIQELKRISSGEFLILTHLRPIWGEVFSRLIKFDNNQVVAYQNYADVFLHLAVSQASIMLVSDRYLKFVNNSLEIISEKLMMPEYYNEEGVSLIAFPVILSVEDCGAGFALAGYFLKYTLGIPPGFYPAYQRGYLAFVDLAGDLVADRKDSAWSYRSIAKSGGSLVAVGTCFQYPGGNRVTLRSFSVPLLLMGMGAESQSSATSFSLNQNYPNPFNPTTTIRYALERGEEVTLKIFDVLGKEVACLVSSFQEAGEHKIDFQASELPSGVYICQLRAGKFSSNIKMILLR